MSLDVPDFSRLRASPESHTPRASVWMFMSAIPGSWLISSVSPKMRRRPDIRNVLGCPVLRRIGWDRLGDADQGVARGRPEVRSGGRSIFWQGIGPRGADIRTAPCGEEADFGGGRSSGRKWARSWTNMDAPGLSFGDDDDSRCPEGPGRPARDPNTPECSPKTPSAFPGG